VRLGTLLAAARLEAAVAPARPPAEVRVAGDGPKISDPKISDPEISDPEISDPEISDPEISDIVIASSQASPGALFGCVPGEHADGHDHAGEAVARGAAALLCERTLDLPVPQVLVPSVRRALGPISAAFWGYPSRAMRVVGVTGTNGKTTTCALLAGIFNAQGWPTGVIGTLTGERTTPEAPVLQQKLAELRDAGRAAVAMEVSSHALDQHRVDGTKFAAGIFTNLSQDHLDYHLTMEAYFASKARLFTSGQVDVAVVNQDGPWGARLAELVSDSGARLVTYAAGDAREVAIGPGRSSFSWRGEQFDLNMAGRFNILNALAAATAAFELGIGPDVIATGLRSVRPVRGRFQIVDAGQPFTVLVDYAHTPAALQETLMAAREMTGRGNEPGGGRGRVLIVFGAGGDRDRTKRPLMGKVACDLADVVVITSDNPRSEPPLAIIEEVASGANGGPHLIEVDRTEAIARILAMAARGDVVLITGKGHETGQDFGTHVEPFDDVEVARKALARRRGGQGLEGRRLTETGPDETGRGEVHPGEVSPDQVSPDQVSPDQVSPDQVSPDQVSAAPGAGGRGRQN
jgi:UDP-N-acetylmuramoyl-L-alanyl-D-glutamate--2,6-diaminopimelate ligase